MDITKLDVVGIVEELNQNVFSNQIPPMIIRWKHNMTRCAGICRIYTESSPSMSLSVALLRTETQVWETIAHEMCHLAVSFIDGGGPPHGLQFKNWSRKVNQVYPSVKISTRHEFHTNFTVPPTYQCQVCQKVHVRNRRLNVTKFKCKCHGTLVRI